MLFHHITNLTGIFRTVMYVQRWGRKLPLCERLYNTRSLPASSVRMKSTDTQYPPPPLRYLEVQPGRKIAYRMVEGTKKPTVMYIPAFFSNMEIKKALVVEKYCVENGHTSVRYDPHCIGESPGDLNIVEFSDWVEDCFTVLNHLTKGPVSLVSSSMGTWLSLLATLKYPDRIHSLLLVGPATNYFWDTYLKIYNDLSKEEQEMLDAGKSVTLKTNKDFPHRRDFFEKTRQFHIDFDQPVGVYCPVRFLHSLQDEFMQYDFSLFLAEKLKSEDVDIIYRKGGDHALMKPHDLVLLRRTLDRLIKEHPVGAEEG